MSQKTYLITGANRGLGLGFSSALISRPNTLIIAAVRNVNNASSAALDSLPKGPNSDLIVVKIDSSSVTDASEAVEELQSRHNIHKIDVVIANAGISKYYGPAATTPIKEFEDHFATNVVGPVTLFQTTWPLLEKSASPVFVVLSTGIASLSDMGDIPIPAAAYGASKATLNYIVRKIHFEHEKLIAFPISPGYVHDQHALLPSFC